MNKFTLENGYGHYLEDLNGNFVSEGMNEFCLTFKTHEKAVKFNENVLHGRCNVIEIDETYKEVTK